jgi:hypothetical protein
MLLLTLFFLPLSNHTCFVIVIYQKHHFIIVILHLINMESSNLSHLSSDFWIDISPFLTSIELGRLSMIGYKLLLDKFTSGISSFVHRPRLQRRYSLPYLFFSFPNLLHLEITLPYTRSDPEWRTIDLIDISLLPKSLKSLNLNLDRIGEDKWLNNWLSSSLSSGMTLHSLLPNLTSFTFKNQDWEIRPNSTESLLPLLSLPLVRLSLPLSIHILPSHISTFLNHHTLIDLEIALPKYSSSSSSSTSHPSSSPTSSSIIFPPNLTTLHVHLLPTNFPFILLPRTILDLHIKFAPKSGDGDMDEQLKDWPPNLTKLSLLFGDGYYASKPLFLTSAIASSLPRTLISLNWAIQFFENPNVLQEMPPNLIECSTKIQNKKELISSAIPLLPKTLTSIHANYLYVPSLWKYLPRTITSIEDMGWQPTFNSDSSPFIQDLPPLVTYLESYISFFQPSCLVLKNITRLEFRDAAVKIREKIEIFFKLISTQLPHLEWLDLGWNRSVDGSLLDILQQPLKTLHLTCDPRTLNFNSGKWSKSLQVLNVLGSDDIKFNRKDIRAFIEQRDPNWHLPATLTSLSSEHSLVIFSPSSPEYWPPNLTQIKISKLDLKNSTILWISLPSSLLELEFHAKDGKIDLLSHPTFIDSLKCLPPGIISFKLNHPLYKSYRYSSLYQDSEGKFCFPDPILDLAKTHPRLACIQICDDELDLSKSYYNPRATEQQKLRERPPKQKTGRNAKKTINATPYGV